MYEIIRWVSLVLLWFACGLNVYAMIRIRRTSEELDRQVEIWKERNGYSEETE